MIKVIARITLYPSSKGRKTPFLSGYRPLFEFPGYQLQTSGSIDLIENKSFDPGETQVVHITFLETVLKRASLSGGTKFVFGEGRITLGEGEILEVFP